MTNIDTMKLALDKVADTHRLLRQAIREAEQAEQEPVALIEKQTGFETEVYATGYAESLPDGVWKLFTAPPKAEQEPVACYPCEIVTADFSENTVTVEMLVDGYIVSAGKKYLCDTAPPQREWVNPNDKSQKRYLPQIGEKVLFCYEGRVYFGHHTGGSFKSGIGVTAQTFYTWDCHWMPLPVAIEAKLKEKNHA